VPISRATRVIGPGDTVSISLEANNSCTGATQQYQGTYTVQNGLITAADITQTG
jgi:hypothetical protein